MRLIDADAIEWGSSVGITHKSIIDKMPTIDAIPIEWVVKWNEDYAPRDYQEMTEDMIADWREEQNDEQADDKG